MLTVKSAILLAVLPIVLVFPGGCRRTASPAPRPPIAAGDVRSKTAFYSVVFYYAPDPAAPTEATARALAGRYFPDTPFTPQSTKPPQPPVLLFDEEHAPLKACPVPEAAYFDHSGRGLTPDDIAAFQKTTIATQFTLVIPRDEVWNAARKFTELAYEFATATHAYLWDSATRECFSPAAWRTQRLDTWPADQLIPELSHHTTLHIYPPAEDSPYLRAVTLGMEKFALPDLVVEQSIGSDSRPTGNMINLVCQSLAEHPVITDGASERFQIANLQQQALRERLQTTLEKSATQQITLALLPGQRQDGDADNALLELDFRNAPGRSVDERREAALSQLWGSRDSITKVKHDAGLGEASQRARAHLPGLQAAFTAGLPPGQRLLLKAPFHRDDNDGNEWMWIEVLHWPKPADTIEGVLQNDPFYIKALKSGSKVTVRESDIFDYILYHPDGTMEGNETGRLIEKAGESTLQK